MIGFFGFACLLPFAVIALDCGTRKSINTNNTRKHIEENIYFQFYSAHYGSLTNYTKIPFECGLNILDQPGYDSSLKTVISMSGFTERPSLHSVHESVYYVVNGFTKYLNVNLVVINYEKIVHSNFRSLIPLIPIAIDYVASVKNASTIGHTLTYFFRDFIKECNCEDNLHVVAVSLGVQILHYVAQDLIKDGIKLKRVTALEAAGPLYIGTGDHFTKEDAVFVDAIHTDGGSFGFIDRYGTVDFIINGGLGSQPGCENITLWKGANIIDVMKCNHYMALFYYIESMKKPLNFPAQKCDSYEQWQNLSCINNKITYFGYYVDTKINGNYYFNTNKRPPYGRGIKGTFP